MGPAGLEPATSPLSGPDFYNCFKIHVIAGAGLTSDFADPILTPKTTEIAGFDPDSGQREKVESAKVPSLAAPACTPLSNARHPRLGWVGRFVRFWRGPRRQSLARCSQSGFQAAQRTRPLQHAYNRQKPSHRFSPDLGRLLLTSSKRLWV